ncbi:MAG: TlpA family protein disulfide reductase [Pseudobdellovibrio sp.]
MLKKSLIAFLVLAVISGAGFYFYSSRHITQDERLELLTKQKNINGFVLKPELFESEFLIINFWASWCPPCIEETPSLIKFSKTHPEFKLIAISQDDTLNDIQNFTKLFPNFKNAGVDVVFDQSRVLARRFGVEKLPETFIYNRLKKKYFQISGSTNWDDPELLSYIKKNFEKN